MGVQREYIGWNFYIVGVISCFSGGPLHTSTMPTIQAGEVFGQLTVLEVYPPRGPKGVRAVKCRCTCGNEKVVSKSDNLRFGNTRSCGCLKRGPRMVTSRDPDEGPVKRNSKVSEINVGDTFGRLLIIGEMPNLDNKRVPDYLHQWVCKCKCGNICIARGDRIAYRQKRSCGCLAVTAAERQFKLWEARIAFAKERLQRVEQDSIELEKKFGL